MPLIELRVGATGRAVQHGGAGIQQICDESGRRDRSVDPNDPHVRLFAEIWNPSKPGKTHARQQSTIQLLFRVSLDRRYVLSAALFWGVVNGGEKMCQMAA